LGVLFNTNLCQHHAKIFIYSKPGGLFICSGINSLYRGKNSLYRGKTIYTAVYRSIPFELAVTSGFGLKFEFERYLAVYRGRNRYRWVPVRIQRSVKKPSHQAPAEVRRSAG
jgi:hypothetical protein